MGVPRNVGLNGVEPHLPGLPDPVRPLIRMDAEVMQGAGKDAVGLTVKHEVLLADGEGWHGVKSNLE
ncbi:hypothetical protein D3C85_1902810 [compost metagenome]